MTNTNTITYKGHPELRTLKYAEKRISESSFSFSMPLDCCCSILIITINKSNEDYVKYLTRILQQKLFKDKTFAALKSELAR